MQRRNILGRKNSYFQQKNKVKQKKRLLNIENIKQKKHCIFLQFNNCGDKTKKNFGKQKIYY